MSDELTAEIWGVSLRSPLPVHLKEKLDAWSFLMRSRLYVQNMVNDEGALTPEGRTWLAEVFVWEMLPGGPEMPALALSMHENCETVYYPHAPDPAELDDEDVERLAFLGLEVYHAKHLVEDANWITVNRWITSAPDHDSAVALARVENVPLAFARAAWRIARKGKITEICG